MLSFLKAKIPLDNSPDVLCCLMLLWTFPSAPPLTLILFLREFGF